MSVINKKYGFTFAGPKRRRFYLTALAILSGMVSAQAAFAANITVASPINGTTDHPQFGCELTTLAAMVLPQRRLDFR